MLHAYLEGVAATHADRVAVIEASGAQISYGALDALAGRVRDRLVAAGVRPGDRVGICIRKSIDALASIFGILKAGAAYVPVDPIGPPARSGFMLADCGIRALLVEEGSAAALLGEVRSRGGVPEALVVSGAGAGAGLERMLDACGAAAAVPSAEVDDAALAYILYTSGSTGVPKGVMLSHGNAQAFVEWAVREFEPAPDDRFSSHAPFHFDLSILDIYVPIAAGAALVLVPEDVGKDPTRLSELISSQRISVWYSAPSILGLLAAYGKLERHDFTSLRSVLFAGEVFPVTRLRALQAHWPHARYFNLYGPTETNVCTFHEVPGRVPDGRTDPYPIGATCPFCESAVIDPDGAPVAPGREGELCIRGPGVMQGYWNRPELTDAAFVRVGDGDPWYRTGDLVVQQANGDHVFVGRRDRMVKKRGYRVELGEIEACLHQYPGIADVAVVATAGDDGVTLRAHLVAMGERPSLIELKRFCAGRLPLYMVPDYFAFHELLPRTSTDKIDYQALGES